MKKTLGQVMYGEKLEAKRLERLARREAERATARAKRSHEAEVRAKARVEKREAKQENPREKGAFAQAFSDYNTAIVNTTEFAGVKLRADTKTISHKGHSGPVDSSTSASVDNSGQIDRRMTMTRVGAGAILFGPAGAIVGGLAKKKLDSRKLYLTIEGATYAWVIELDAKDEKKARAFAAKVNLAARS